MLRRLVEDRVRRVERVYRIDRIHDELVALVNRPLGIRTALFLFLLFASHRMLKLLPAISEFFFFAVKLHLDRLESVDQLFPLGRFLDVLLAVAFLDGADVVLIKARITAVPLAVLLECAVITVCC